MTDIVVVFHSGYGHTQRVAQSVADGADAPLLQIDADGNLPSGGWELLAAADAIIMGSPTYMGGVSWQFKKFADASSKVWFVQGWRGKLFAGFTNSSGMNGDKDATLTYLWHFASQHGGLWVPLGIPPSHDKAARRDSLNYVGGYAGLLTTSPTDASPAEMAKGDLETAFAFGEEVARVAALRR
ncbi:flavodoxin family protein [Variovorax defluvii]|uniref:Flavoprotein WrbA n=1 Tax=Variovorax defluvii TaxID=913761 RepID=A0ABP8HM85_9BURK